MKHISKKSLFGAIFFLLFFGIISYSFGEEFFSFQESQKEKQKYEKTLFESSRDFNYNTVIELGNEIVFHSTPDLAFLDALVSDIQNAQEKVWLEVYIFTEKRILEALIGAHNRGVEVKVLLENNPYMAPHLNNKNYNLLSDAGVPVTWSDPLNYALNHSKFILIDNKAYVSTGNYSYASFKSNRDIFLEITESEILSQLETLFTYDYNHEPFGVMHPNIVLSPDNSRSKIEGLFNEAKESIDMYFPYMSDSGLLGKVIETAERGVDIRFIIGIDAQENSVDEIIRLRDTGVEVFFMKNPKLHAKAVLMDKEILYVGSINFSYHSMDSNREVGLLLKDRAIIQDFIELFEGDISKIQ